MDPKKLVKRKTYCIEVEYFEDGSSMMTRENQGFSVLEMLGITAMLQQQLNGIMQAYAPNVDDVLITSTGSPITHKD
jgi:hypothetical protein